MDLNVGTLVRDYEITGVLSTASMGEVFLAKERLLNRTVVLKRMSRNLTAQEGFSARFQNEARIQAQLTHPNIVGLLSFFEEAGEYFMVLEYAPGITLRELIDRTGPIPEARVLKIFRQIATALSYAHSKGIVHRDIKPSNIMVDTANGDNVKVMDFGVALLMKADHLTRTGSTVGTVYYMSPEQVNAIRDIDQRSDIYSTGVLLYEMLSGKLPFDVDTDSQFQIQSRIVSVEVPDPRTAYPYISESSVAMLKAMTHKDRSHRPESFEKVLALEYSGDSYSYSSRQDIVPAVKDKKPEVVPPVNRNNIQSPQQPDRAAHSGNRKPLVWIIVSVLIVGIGITLAIVLTHKKEVETQPWNLTEMEAAEEPAPTVESSQPVENASIPASGMVYLQGGSFTMGSYNQMDEQPVRQVYVSPFYMAVNEVTRDEWRRVMGSNPTGQQPSDHPASSITWFHAIDYCNARSMQEGLQPCYTGFGDNIGWNRSANGYRLPTEAEWEFAARGGVNSQGYLFSGSDDIGAVGWYGSNSAQKSHPVRSLSPNELGLYDMTGNVWEWCWDWYDSEFYSGSATRNPVNDTFSGKRVVRGGCWVDYPEKSTVSRRSNLSPSQKGGYIGFRVCRNA